MRSTAVFRIVSMIALCGFSFFRYMRSAGLTGGQGIMVLSSHEGANWGRGDLRRARTLVSLRRLDLIKHLEIFLSSLVSLLPPETSFVGCFSQRNSVGGDHPGLLAGFHSGLTPQSNSGYPELSRDRVSAILERSGLVVLDMKQLNGLTYFHSRKKHNPKTNQ
ncbi:hypothetical protein EG830_13425 [bacterium]|nr:hypothetical protein [bacterium]